MKKLSLSIAVFFSTFFSPHLFSANLLVDYDEHKEGSYSTQQGNQVEQPKQVYDHTILNNKNINHILEDIEEVEEDLRDDVSAVNQRLVTSNNQSTPLLLGAVLRHEKSNEYHQYLIADTGLLSKSTQLNAVKRAHRKGFHLIKATRGHVCLQLLEWLQISKHYIVIALQTNRPVCRNCYLIANSLWEKELKTNEKGCIEAQFSVLDKMPNLAQQYINTHLNFPLVQNLVVPMMGYVSKEEMNKAIQKKDEQITMLSNEVKTKNKQIQEHTNELSNKNERIETLRNQLKDKKKKLDEKSQQLNEFKSTLKESSVKHQQELKKKKELIETLSDELNERYQELDECDEELEEKDEKINILNKETNKKDNQLKEKDQKIAELQKLLEEQEKNRLLLDDDAKKELFNAIKNNNIKKVKISLYHYKDVVSARDDIEITPFLCAAENGHLAIAKLLKDRGTNIHAKDLYGYNALHLACLYSGNVEMVKWLLDVCKLEKETKGRYEMTPFLCAACNGQLAIAKLLKEQGANIYAKIENGSNALKLASENNADEEMISYLKSLGLT